MTFGQLSAIFEPVNSQRKILGFDTFSGFPELSERDKGPESEFAHKGGLGADTFEALQKAISLYDSTVSFPIYQKVEFIRGCIPDYSGICQEKSAYCRKPSLP